MGRTSQLAVTVARGVAVGVGDETVGGRQLRAAPTITASGQAHDGLALADAYWLTVAGGLVLGGALVGQGL